MHQKLYKALGVLRYEDKGSAIMGLAFCSGKEVINKHIAHFSDSDECCAEKIKQDKG